MECEGEHKRTYTHRDTHSFLDKTPDERAHALATTPLFANIHAETASTGQTAAPSDLDTDLHFTCFVSAPDADIRNTAQGAPLSDAAAKGEKEGTGMRLIELDGRRVGPIDRGECTDLLTVSPTSRITTNIGAYFHGTTGRSAVRQDTVHVDVNKLLLQPYGAN